MRATRRGDGGRRVFPQDADDPPRRPPPRAGIDFSVSPPYPHHQTPLSPRSLVFPARPLAPKRAAVHERKETTRRHRRHRRSWATFRDAPKNRFTRARGKGRVVVTCRRTDARTILRPTNVIDGKTRAKPVNRKPAAATDRRRGFSSAPAPFVYVTRNS